MAVAVSGFHASHISLDDQRSPHPISPATFNQNCRSVLPQWVEYMSRGSSGTRDKRHHVTHLTASSCAKSFKGHQASQLISYDPIYQSPPTHDAEGKAPDSNGRNENSSRFPFQKWMGSLQKRAYQPSFDDTTSGNRVLSWVWALEDEACNSKPVGSAHIRSSSASSFRYVSAIRSASTSFAGSRTNTALSQCLSQADFEVESAKVPSRSSDDNKMVSSLQQMDGGSVDRALQRQKILHELINTERSYLGDIRFLLNVSTMLPKRHLELTLHQGLRYHVGFASFLASRAPKIRQSKPLRYSATPRGNSERGWSRCVAVGRHGTQSIWQRSVDRCWSDGRRSREQPSGQLRR